MLRVTRNAKARANTTADGTVSGTVEDVNPTSEQRSAVGRSIQKGTTARHPNSEDTEMIISDENVTGNKTPQPNQPQTNLSQGGSKSPAGIKTRSAKENKKNYNLRNRSTAHKE